MYISTQVTLTIPYHSKRVLWGILHHHVLLEDLDEEEKSFIAESLSALDADKAYETSYMHKQGMTR